MTAAVRTFADHGRGEAAVLTERLTKSYGRQRSRGVVGRDSRRETPAMLFERRDVHV